LFNINTAAAASSPFDDVCDERASAASASAQTASGSAKSVPDDASLPLTCSLSN
jgi:hypothetical protein